MISLVIYAVLAISLAASAGYAVITFFQASNATRSGQENIARLDTATAILRAQLRAALQDGVAYPPMGDAGAGYTVLPSWLVAPDRTIGGARFAYCPASPTGGTPTGTTLVTQSDGTTYNVAVTNSVATGGRDYVTQSVNDWMDSSLVGRGVIALLISGVGNGAPPACSAVSYVNGSYRAAGGSVRAITTGTTQAQIFTAASQKAVVYVATAAAGAANGMDSANPMLLADAVAQWSALKPRALEIRLAAGSYSLADTALNLISNDTGNPSRLSLLLVGAGAGTTTINVIDGPDSGTTVENPVLSVNTQIEDVTISGAGLTVVRETLTLADANVGAVTVTGGRLNIVGTVTTGAISSVTSDVMASGASWSVNSTAASSISMVGGSLQQSGGTLSIGGTVTTGIDVIGANLLISGANIAFPNNGALGIRISDGGRVVLRSGSLGANGARPIIGVQDDGAASVAGTGYTIYAAANSCWSPQGVFARSLNTVGTGASRPQPPTGDWTSTVATTPTAAEVMAAGDNAYNFAFRNALRLVNLSNWSCQAG